MYNGHVLIQRRYKYTDTMWLLLGIVFYRTTIQRPTRQLDVSGPSCVTMMVESTLCKLVAVGCI